MSIFKLETALFAYDTLIIFTSSLLQFRVYRDIVIRTFFTICTRKGGVFTSTQSADERNMYSERV